MPNLVKLLTLCSLFVTPFAALADDTFRNSIAKEAVKVNVAKDLGRVIYDHSKSRNQFASVAGKKMSKDTLGVTIAKLQIEGSTETTTSKVPGGYLVYINTVNMQLFYGNIIVLIDKRYPVGSCEYNTIIEHENQHVGIARMVIDFYAPYVKKELERIASEIEPVRVKSAGNAGMVGRKFNQEIQRKIEPMMELIDEQLEKGNANLDTPENYAKESAKCSNW